MIDSQNWTPRHAKLPFWQTVLDAYRVTFSNLGQLLRISWPWLLLITLISTANAFYERTFLNMQPTLSLTDWTIQLLHQLLIVATGAAIAVPWHRYILLGDTDAGLKPATLHRIATYSFFGFLLFAPGVAAELLRRIGILANSDLPTLLDFALFLVFCLLTVRMSIALPMIALGLDWSHFWTITHGNFWRLFWGGLISIALALVVSVGIIVHLASSWEPGGPLVRDNKYIAWSVLLDLIWMFGGMSYVTFLSLAFRHFFARELKDKVQSPAK